MRAHVSLQHTATHCNTLQHTATHCNICFIPQHTATYCNVLQSSAKHCNTHRRSELELLQVCNTLQHTATHCNALQRNALQHTATHIINLSERRILLSFFWRFGFSFGFIFNISQGFVALANPPSASLLLLFAVFLTKFLTYMFFKICIYMYMCIYAYMYIYICLCVCVYIYPAAEMQGSFAEMQGSFCGNAGPLCVYIYPARAKERESERDTHNTTKQRDIGRHGNRHTCVTNTNTHTLTFTHTHIHSLLQTHTHKVTRR